jgi:hypothetical protein
VLEMIRRFAFAAVTLASLAFMNAPASAHQVAVGTLECRSPGGVSLIISLKDYSCRFFTDWGQAFNYGARLSSLGLQAGITRNEVLIWRVWAPTARIDPGVLRGNYVGASAGAAIVVGLGANVLVGGSQQTISLQPVSVEAKTGVNFAIAGSALSLQ